MGYRGRFINLTEVLCVFLGVCICTCVYFVRLYVLWFSKTERWDVPSRLYLSPGLYFFPRMLWIKVSGNINGKSYMQGAFQMRNLYVLQLEECTFMSLEDTFISNCAM